MNDWIIEITGVSLIIIICGAVMLCMNMNFNHEANMADKSFCQTTIVGRTSFVWHKCK